MSNKVTAYHRQDGELTGKLRMQAGHYTPSESMEKSANNPVPIEAIQLAADAYIEAHPVSKSSSCACRKGLMPASGPSPS